MADLPPLVQASILGDMGRRVVGINESTRQKLIRAIADGIADGLGAAQLGDLIESSAAFGEYRAELIARTETNRVLNVSQLSSFKHYGVNQVQAIDGDMDAECAARNGQVYSVEEANNIEDHPNGTLDWSPVVFTQEPNPTPPAPPRIEELPERPMPVERTAAEADLVLQDVNGPANMGLEAHKGSRFVQTQDQLRGKQRMTAETRRIVKSIDEGMKPLSSDVYSYRAVSQEALDLIGDVGSVFKDAGYMSTSVDYRMVAEIAQQRGTRAVIRVVNRSGQKAYYYNDFKTDRYGFNPRPAGQGQGESELLLPRGGRYRVVSRHKSPDGFEGITLERM